MLIPMYALPPFPVALDGTAELCTPDPNLQGLGDPFGITDLATAFANYSVARSQQDLQRQQLAIQLQAQKAQQAEDAQNFASQTAQSAVSTATSARNSTLYALAGVGGVAALIGTAFLLAAMKGKKR